MAGIAGWSGLRAQDGGYLYLESDPSLPFYIRTSDSLVLSSPGNFLILAPLRHWTGDIVVGLQGQPQPVFQFAIKDTLVEAAYLLKNSTDGWRLIDVQKNENVTIRRLGRNEQQFANLMKRSDAFALRLSQAVNDSSILYHQPYRGNALATGGSTPAAAPRTAAIPGAEQKRPAGKAADSTGATAAPAATAAAAAEKTIVTTGAPVREAPVAEKENTASVAGQSPATPLTEKAPAEKITSAEKASTAAKTPPPVNKSDDGKARGTEKKGGLLSVFSRKGNETAGKSGGAPADNTESNGVRRLFKTDMGSSWKLIYEVDDLGKRDTIEIDIIKPPVAGKKTTRRK